MGYRRPTSGLGLGNIRGLSTYESSITSAKIFGQDEYYQWEHAEVIEIDLNPEKPEHVGRVKFRTFDNKGADDTALSWAFPLIPYYRAYPVLHELVVVTSFNGRFYWLSVLNALNLLNNNMQANLTEGSSGNAEGDSSTYKETYSSGIPNSSTEKGSSPGDTFKNQRMKIGLLSPNEGDVIIEGRFSQSIRLGNNPDSNLPNIKISVRDLLEEFAIDKENLDEDSCIFITTDELITFNPIGIPISDVNNPPHEYNGKQIILLSDRLIFGSKLNEILLFSNKTISLASNDNFSVDTDKKIITNSAQNTEMNTKQKVIVKAEQNIELNTKQQALIQSEKETKIKATKVMIGKLAADQPLVLGTEWKNMMESLIDIILQHTHATGTGPTAGVLPPDIAKLQQIKSQLKNQLSDDNFTTKKNG